MQTVRPAIIEALLDSAETEEAVLFGKVTVVSYRLPATGFVVTGVANAADPSKFDIEIGRRCAREDAARQLWVLETYKAQVLANRKVGGIYH
jgi:hypothetical protein